MSFTISPDTTTDQLKSAFADAFPGLRLGFFTKAHHAFESSPAKHLISQHDVPLGQLSARLSTGTLEISPSTRVSDLESMLESDYGLHVQVFRKSGNIWLETSVSDHLTLSEQQERARASEHVQQEFVDPMDYRERD